MRRELGILLGVGLLGMGLLSVVGSALAATYTVTEGSQASYSVREQLARVNFPSDAVGVTEGVSGSIVLAEDGSVQEGSEIVVDVSTLVSDESRRDGYLQRSSLESETYPEVIFVPTEIRGTTFPLPESGEVPLEILGDLTVRDVTREVVWQGTATVEPSQVQLTASTTFTFEEFEMEKPSVMSVLSVADDITLEIALVLDEMP